MQFEARRCLCFAGAAKPAKSRFVAREIRAALEDETRQIVPVLLCDEKLPFKLRQWQWINLKGKVVHTCRPKVSLQPRSSIREECERGTGSELPNLGMLMVGSLVKRLESFACVSCPVQNSMATSCLSGLPDAFRVCVPPR